MYPEILGSITGLSSLISIIVLWNKKNRDREIRKHQELIKDFCIDYYDTPIEL